MLADPQDVNVGSVHEQSFMSGERWSSFGGNVDGETNTRVRIPRTVGYTITIVCIRHHSHSLVRM